MNYAPDYIMLDVSDRTLISAEKIFRALENGHIAARLVYREVED